MGFQDREYYKDPDDSQGGLQVRGPRMMVTNLVILNVVIFLVDAFTPVVTMDIGGEYVNSRWLDSLLSLDANLIRAPWGIYQLVTYGFVHAPIGSSSNIFHVGMNMFMLWMFGRDIELRYGRQEFLRFYLAAIVFAGVAWLAVHNLVFGDFQGGMLGASGGVTAVLILFVLNFPRRTLYLWGVVAIPAWVAGVAWILLDLFGAFGGQGHVAYEAHLAGAAFAFAYFRMRWDLGKWVPRNMPSPGKWIQSRPKLRVHDPDEQSGRGDTDADRILEKLHRQGQESLTPRERRILEDYSRRMRQKHGQDG